MMMSTTILTTITMMMFSCPDSEGRCHVMAVGGTMVLVIGDEGEGKKYKRLDVVGALVGAWKKCSNIGR